MATGRLIVEEYAGKVGIYRQKYSGVWYTLWNFASPSCLNAFPVAKKFTVNYYGFSHRQVSDYITFLFVVRKRLPFSTRSATKVAAKYFSFNASTNYT